MPDFRVHCTPPTADSADLVLSPEESHHLVVVNRARTGDRVVAFDGQGTEWISQLLTADKRAARLRVESKHHAGNRPFSITLAQALPKGSHMDDIVRQATEIGAAQIVPLLSERTQVHLEAERSDRKIEKWRTVALEAAKQCGNPWLPHLTPIQSIAAFIPSARDYDLKLVASLQPTAKSLKAVLAAYSAQHSKPPARVLWLVGPEGDFSPAELSASHAAGFEPITLGPLVLRCETAATYALSVLSYELQNG